MSATDFPLTLREHDADWFSIEGEGYERLQWASIEGTGDQMLAIATAIERRAGESFTRVRLRWEGATAMLSSPRNSQTETPVSTARLDALVPIIRSVVAERRAQPPEPIFGEDEGEP